MPTKAKEAVPIGKVLNKKSMLGVYGLFDKKYPNLSYWILDGAMKVKGRKVDIRFSHQTNLDYFKGNHDDKMKECCREFFEGNDFEITYSVDKSLLPDEKSVPRRVDDYSPKKQKKSKKTFPYKTKGLDDLVLFQGNRAVIEEGRSILDLLEQREEPQSVLYIHGPNGSGKTQFMSSVGKDALEKGILMRYLRIRHILDHFRTHDGRSPSLSEYLKDARILSIDSFDDIFNPRGDPLKGVQSLIQEFFDYALERGIQIILASTQDSGELVERLAEAENPALRDRVAGVKKVEIELPFDDRVDFLMKFIPSLIDNYPQGKGELEKIAQFYHGCKPAVSIREMAGTLLTASTIARRARTEINPGIINRVLYHQYKFGAESSLKPMEVFGATVNLLSDLDVKEITKGTRTAAVVEVRNHVSFALSRLCGLNSGAIAKIINKTHSTALRGIDETLKKLDTSEKQEAFLNSVKSRIKKK
jgi:chromosomal replication initiation ATPase DnaA